MKKITVVIPTHNGKNLLEEYLPSLKIALEFYTADSEIIIVDNGSSDDSESFLRSNYPPVRILKNRTNEGFGPAVNRGVREAKYDIVLLLNNDIRVEKDFIAPLVRHFDDPDVFAVVSKSLVKLADRIVNETVTVPGFDGGLFLAYQPQIQDDRRIEIKSACTNLHASGGCGAFDRRKFLELGGFDDIYHPFYYEDVDLSYQAWKRGWLVLYEPTSVVHHRSHSTSRKVASDSYINRIELRNRFLLTWKNISDATFVLSHIKWLLYLLIKSIYPSKRYERHLMSILLSASRRLPAVITHRIKNAKYVKLSDKKIFHLAANRDILHLKFDRLLSEAPPEPSTGPNILFIEPIGYQKGSNVELADLAGALKQCGYKNVDILDLNNVLYDIPDVKIIEFVKKRSYDIIGFSITKASRNSSIQVAKFFKQHYPKATLVAGGAHITLNYNEFMEENSEFDYAAVGDGELPIIELCKMIESGSKHPIVGIYDRKWGL
jgi:GT2 family glycosyltransferase